MKAGLFSDRNKKTQITEIDIVYSTLSEYKRPFTMLVDSSSNRYYLNNSKVGVFTSSQARTDGNTLIVDMNSSEKLCINVLIN